MASIYIQRSSCISGHRFDLTLQGVHFWFDRSTNVLTCATCVTHHHQRNLQIKVNTNGNLPLDRFRDVRWPSVENSVELLRTERPVDDEGIYVRSGSLALWVVQ